MVTFSNDVLPIHAAPAEAKLSPGPDFMETEETLPQRSGVLSSETPMTGEIPQPRITAPDGGKSATSKL